MCKATPKNPTATLRISQDGWMKMEGGITPAYIETEVEVVYETPESYRVEYSDKFKKKRPDLCTDDIIKKDNKDRRISYTLFIATDALPPPSCPTRHATFKINVMIPMKGMLGFGSEKADVLVVEETDTHYRLRFAAAFAKKHPNLCREWVRKDSTDPKVELIA